MNTKKNLLIFILTFIGFILASELYKIYYDANFNPYSLGSFCSVNDIIDCDGVAKTSYSQFLGIPLALWGIFLYLFILLLLFSNFLSKIKIFKFLEVFKNPLSYIFCLSIIAFIVSMGLAFISIFTIQKICVLCFATYFIDLLIAIFSKDYKNSIWFEFKTSFSDFYEAIKNKNYLIAFISVIIAFTGFLIYTSTTKVLTPQLKNLSFDFSEDIKGKDNTIGSQNAKIIIHEYIDYNCASCYLTNLTIRRLITELDGILVIQHNLPLDSECNPIVTKGHEGSCQMARYSLAAKKQGKYWEANSILFEKTPSSEKEILKNLSEIKGINKKQLKEDANSDEIKQELKQEIDNAIKQKIDATPTIIINMQKITGNMPYNTFKEKLINNGATEKGIK